MPNSVSPTLVIIEVPYADRTSFWSSLWPSSTSIAPMRQMTAILKALNARYQGRFWTVIPLIAS